MRKKLLYCFVLSMAGVSAMAQQMPVADLLDVQFNLDGSAVDVSPMKNEVEYVGSGTVIEYSSIFEGNVATFDNVWSTKSTGYYRINFEENEEFRNAVADGHSLEILVKANYDGPIQNVECKPFSAMQGGGTGFLICTTSASGSGGKNVFTYLPNVSTSGASTWRWTTSGVVPLSGFYYHVIGVWNKEEQKSYIYVDGQLRNTIDAPGDFRFAQSGCNWFCIGGDASANGAEAGWNGSLYIARVYDKPLTSEDVALLWGAVGEKEKEANLIVYQEIVQEGQLYINDLAASQALISEYEEALLGLENLMQAGTTEELEAQYAVVSDLRTKLAASVTAYANYKTHAEAAIASLEENASIQGEDRDYIEQYLYEYFEPNEDYPNGSYLYIWENRGLDDAAIAAETDWVDEKLRIAIENGYIPGSDITNLITNASFANGFTGWKGTVGTGATKSLTNDFYGAECYAKGFNMYQTLTGLENGLYVISASGAYRPFDDRYSNYYYASMYANENYVFLPTVYETRLPVSEAEDGVNCYLTVNGSDVATDLEISADGSEEVTDYGIHGMTSIANAAAAGRAVNYMVANVTDGTLTIGFKNPNANAATDWTGIANISLLYAGALQDGEHYIDETLKCMVARAETILNNIPDSGDYMQNPNFPQEIKDRLRAALNSVESATTAEQKYALIGTFSALWDEVIAGRNAYVSMINESEACAIAVGDMVAGGQIAIDEANDLYDVIQGVWTVYNDGSYTTEQALAMQGFKDAGLIPSTDENGTYLISSNYDMAYFTGKVNSVAAPVNGKLLADIDYFTENQMMNNFYGELDGDYHTITVNINRAARGAALIDNMQNGSCVKNLTIKGEVTNSNKFVTAVAANTYGFTTISSIVSLINGHSTCVGDSGNGGVMSCSRGGTVVKDCVFAGTMEGDAAINSSGIVGWTNDGGSCFTEVDNCLQIGDITLNPEGSRTIARIPQYVNISNCYYKTAFGVEEGTQITDEQLASGEVCYLLNRGNTENPTWFQTLGEDPFPVPNPNHKPVGKKADGTFSNDPSEWQTVEPGPTTPQADLLDVVFHEDGTAEDVSPRHNTVTRVGETSSVYYNETYQRYVAHFENPWGGTCSGFYQAESYEDTEISALLADGHSLEVLCMANYEGTIPNVEAKPFSAMQSGGTGFLISTISGTRQNELTFLPNVTTSGANTWRWVISGVVPESQVFYHVVGVYNKEEQKTYIYVNGELKNTVNAPGMFRFANTGCNWFAIGGDPANATSAHGSWIGDVAIARAYDKPLTAEDVAYLWEKVQNPNGIGALKPAPQAPIGIYRLDGVRVDKAQKGLYIIDGKKTLVK